MVPAVVHLTFRIPRVADAVLLLVLCVYVLAGTPLVPFHGDEATQIYMSRDYAYQFQQRDLDLVRFRDDSPSPEEQYLRLINGSLNKYTVGLAWHAAGLTLADINEQWDWAADWTYNTTTGHAPSPVLLGAARWPSALFTAAGVVALFALGWVVGGRPVAWLAALYLALNPVVLINGRRAMMEGSMLLFEILTVLAGVWFLRRPSWARALALGACAGLALAAKHTNLFTVAPVFAACILYPLIDRRFVASLRRLAAYLLGAGLLSAVVFYALNPVWWGGNALQHVLLILRLRSELLAGQTAAFGGYAGRADQFAGFVRQAFGALPQYYEVPNWADWIGDQIARYESTLWRGISVGGGPVGAVVLLVLVAAGWWWFLRSPHQSRAGRWLLGWWAVALLLTTWLLTPVEWGRYYVPVYPVIGLFAAYGVVQVYRTIAARVVPR